MSTERHVNYRYDVLQTLQQCQQLLLCKLVIPSTHVASTAASSAVSNATLLGYAIGTAHGMASQARMAAYKVCWTGDCFASRSPLVAPPPPLSLTTLTTSPLEPSRR